MTHSVDSLVVIPTRRGRYAAEDLCRASRWSCLGPAAVYVVDASAEPIDGIAGATVLRAEQTGVRPRDGFLAGLGLMHAVDKGVQFRQAIVLDDSCLVMRRGIDQWAIGHTQRDGVGLLGVHDRLNYEDAYDRCRVWFDNWAVPHESFEPGPYTLHDAALWLSGGLVASLYRYGLLTPDGCASWPLTYGAYVSWVSQMLGFYQVGWGHMDKRLPPLFVNHTGRSRHQPEPHILSDSFLLYYSVRHCVAYSEEELREAYKRARGEEAGEVTPLRPHVSPGPRGPTERG